MSQQSSASCKHLRMGRRGVVGFRFNCVNPGHRAETQRETGLPLVEKEDIHGSYTSHDPDQPAHVARPGSQLPEHQPGETHHMVGNYDLIHQECCPSGVCVICWLESLDPPGRVGSSNEEVNGHSVTHVETLLQLPIKTHRRSLYTGSNLFSLVGKKKNQLFIIQNI